MGLDGNGDGFSDLAVVADPYFMQIMDKNSAYQLLFQSHRNGDNGKII